MMSKSRRGQYHFSKFRIPYNQASSRQPRYGATNPTRPPTVLLVGAGRSGDP